MGNTLIRNSYDQKRNNYKEGSNMKATINRSGCISCGLCIGTCPEVFHLAGDGLAEVIAEEVPAELEDKAIEAKDSCPVSVIEVE